MCDMLGDNTAMCVREGGWGFYEALCGKKKPTLSSFSFVVVVVLAIHDHCWCLPPMDPWGSGWCG